MVRGGPANRAVKRAKIFALTKGFRGRRKNCYSLAVRAAHKALQYAYIGRRLKKRDMRKLWIQRINYAAQQHRIRYSRFMNSLVQCDIQLNRKVLSELAIHEPRTFQALAEIAKQRQRYGLLSALDDDKAKEYLEEEEEEGKEAPEAEGTRPHKRPWKEVLYETREYFDESRGRKVRETAV